MRKLPIPIRVPDGYRLAMTQPYANTGLNDWYARNGITAPFHNGVDLVITDRLGRTNWTKTYGAALITPTSGWRIVKITFDTPMATKGNGITIESPEYVENGVTKKSQVVFWHCSATRSLPGTLPAFTEVAYIGNSGLVRPEPSPVCAHCGSHLHLMLFDYTFNGSFWTLDNNNNGVGGAIDPLTRFDLSNVIYGADTSVDKDLPPLQYFFAVLKKRFAAISSGL